MSLSLSNKNDMLKPSQECVKPVKALEVTKDETVPLSVTLNDCLACSGCITSAETVLVSNQTFHELLKALDLKKCVYVSLSPQSVSSIAAKYNISFNLAYQKLAFYFKSLGCEKVLSTNIARDFSLIASADEFIKRYTNENLPMLTSSCPGWICYAEKTHSQILPLIDTTKSPQQIMGSFVKSNFGDVFHVTVMPCYDKKLEAARSDFRGDDVCDVDCVLATVDLELMWNERGENFEKFGIVETDVVFSHPGSSAGGFLENTLRTVSERLFSLDSNLNTKVFKKNKDYVEYHLVKDDKTLLRFASAYGFRNIQNIVRKLKSGSLKLDFLEIMACPSACIGGGGQLRGNTLDATKELMLKATQVYNNIPKREAYIHQEYRKWFNENAKLLHTEYHAAEQKFNFHTDW